MNTNALVQGLLNQELDAATGGLSSLVSPMFAPKRGGGGGSVSPAMPKGGLQSLAARIAAKKFGWGKDQWDDLNQLVSHESSWNPKADNPTSTAYGLFQFLDSTRQNYNLPLHAGPKQQINKGLQYVKDRYGNPEGAWDFWQRNHYY